MKSTRQFRLLLGLALAAGLALGFFVGVSYRESFLLPWEWLSGDSPLTRYRVKRSDLLGVDPVTLAPAEVEGLPFTEEEIVDLTLLNIIKEKHLVTRLDVFRRYSVPTTLTAEQRTHAELTLETWTPEEQVAYFRAAAIVLQAIKELNRDLTYEWLRTPGRVIALPDPESF